MQRHLQPGVVVGLLGVVVERVVVMWVVRVVGVWAWRVVGVWVWVWVWA